MGQKAQDQVEKLRCVLWRLVVVARDSLHQNREELKSIGNGKARDTLLNVEDVEMTDQGHMAIFFKLLKQGGYWEFDLSARLSDRQRQICNYSNVLRLYTGVDVLAYGNDLREPQSAAFRTDLKGEIWCIRGIPHLVPHGNAFGAKLQEQRRQIQLE